jgi:hypothetical protein
MASNLLIIVTLLAYLAIYVVGDNEFDAGEVILEDAIADTNWQGTMLHENFDDTATSTNETESKPKETIAQVRSLSFSHTDTTAILLSLYPPCFFLHVVLTIPTHPFFLPSTLYRC